MMPPHVEIVFKELFGELRSIEAATVDNNQLWRPDPCRRLCGEASRGS
jgi:hypothetical protein